MSNRDKYYYPAPTYDISPPPAGLIKLGNIISDPKKPHRPLNRTDRVEPENVDTHHKGGVEVNSNEVHKKSLGVWSTFLAQVLDFGIDISGGHSDESSFVIKCEEFETISFFPDDEYILSSLQSKAVRQFGKMLWWQKPVYMVTGIKVVRKVKMESNDEKDWDFKAKAKGDGTSAGVPAEGGVQAKMEQRKNLQMKWTGSDDFVFAYSLFKIDRKRKGKYTADDYTKAALYDDDMPEEEEETVENFHEFWTVESVEDAAADD